MQFLEQKIMKSVYGIKALYTCFNGTGIWGGETMSHQRLVKSHSILTSFWREPCSTGGLSRGSFGS